VLEALDTYFNGRPWNFHTSTKKSGLENSEPQIVPVFLIEKELLKPNLIPLAEELHQVAMKISEANANSSHKVNVKRFVDHRERIKMRAELDGKFLLPLGINHNGSVALSFFNSPELVEAAKNSLPELEFSLTMEELNKYAPLLSELKSLVEYIYIPKEIDSEAFTKLETKEIQVLMGETLAQILNSRVAQSQIQAINNSLNDFIQDLSDELEHYSYRTPTDRQQNLKRSDVNNLIVQAFFNIRKLHKKQGDHWLEISSLSSGEKQKAIVDVAHSLLAKHRDKGGNLVIAIDEPEASLHMSACFDQFNALYDISRQCMQVFFASHWYGFLPIVENGSTTVISKRENGHVFDQINLSSYREQVKKLAKVSKGKLPYDIRLKSLNDFVQSIISSVIGERPFTWIICEGSTERLYLSAYLQDLMKDRRIRIVPVGGANEIKKVYNYLLPLYEEFRDEVSGRIILLSDTDAELVSYKVHNYDSLICKRFVNIRSEGVTKLVNIDSNPVSPATEIEDCLNGGLFFGNSKVVQR